MRHEKILVLGGSGYVGSHLVARLAADQRRVRVPTRRAVRARHLSVLPTVDIIEADIHDPAALAQLARGQDAVINLVGVLQSPRGAASERYGPAFRKAHVEVTRNALAACDNTGVPRFVQMSALGADPQGPSMYQRSKGDAEALVRASALDWTIFQPSVIFGADDSFLNTFAKLAALFPVLPIGGAQARFQPIWVEDVAAAFVNALDDERTFRQTYELAGPKVYTLKELVEFAATATGRRRLVLSLPDSLARLQARLMELAPGEPMLSRDNLDSMKRDNVASVQPYVPAPELKLALTPLEAEAGLYLAGLHPRTRFGGFRARARR